MDEFTFCYDFDISRSTVQICTVWLHNTVRYHSQDPNALPGQDFSTVATFTSAGWAHNTVTLVIHWYIFWHVFKGLYQGANCICDKTNCMPWQIITGSYSCTLDNNGKCDNSDLLQNFYPQGFRPYLYKTSNKYRPRWIQGLSKNKKQFI